VKIFSNLLFGNSLDDSINSSEMFFFMNIFVGNQLQEIFREINDFKVISSAVQLGSLINTY